MVEHLVHVRDCGIDLGCVDDGGRLADFAENPRTPFVAFRVCGAVHPHGYLNAEPFGVGTLLHIARQFQVFSGILIVGDDVYFFQVVTVVRDILVDGTCREEHEQEQGGDEICGALMGHLKRESGKVKDEKSRSVRDTSGESQTRCCAYPLCASTGRMKESSSGKKKRDINVSVNTSASA